MGFAWDVNGKGTTVIRGGAGLVYETVNWEAMLAFNNAFGLGNVPTAATIDAAGDTAGGTITAGNLSIPPVMPQWDSGVPIFGANVSTTRLNCDPVNAAPCPIMSVARNLTTPYVWHWTIGMQHSFTPNLSLEMSYVGNHGSNLVGIRDINQPPVGSGWPVGTLANPGALTLCLQGAPAYDNCNVIMATKKPNDRTRSTISFPYLSNIFQMGNVYRSNYDALQVTLTSRNYHGLSMVAGYTYGHSLDAVGANWDFGYGAGLPQDSANGRTAEYGNSDFDIRNRFTLSFTYAVPGRKSFAQMLEGWELNSIITLQSAQPWGPIDMRTDSCGRRTTAGQPARERTHPLELLRKVI